MLGRNHGTLTNGPTWTGASSRPGGWGAMRFDGSDDVLAINPPFPGNVSTFSISGWASQDVLDVDSTIFTNNNANVFFGTDNFLDFSGEMIFAVRAADASWKRATLDYSQYVSANRWFHWCVVFNGLEGDYHSRPNIYINGARTNIGFVGAMGTSTFGGWSNSQFGTFNGLIDAARIYNRALSSPEVVALYTAEKSYHDGLLNRYDTMAAVSGGVTSAWRYYQQFAGRAG